MIGCVCSGGADSSILLYQLTRTIKNVKVFTFTLENNRPYNMIKTKAIIDFCKKENNCIIEQINVKVPADKTIKEFIIENSLLFESIEILFSGHTENPPLDEVDGSTETNRNPGVYRDILETLGNFQVVHPFYNINKKGIVNKYKHFGVYETLWPLTWSCEGSQEITNNFTKPCNECWWCKERAWSET